MLPYNQEMQSISRILLPVDFSDRCLAILPYALSIASKYDAELTLFHVLNPVYTVPPAGPFGPAIVSLPPSVFEEHTQRLEVFGAEALKGCQVRRLIYEGDPAEQIIAYANSEDFQLVILPTHGLGVLRRFLIGSVAAKVLHDVTCPVLTGVHMEQPSQSKAHGFSNVLCAVDLGPNSEPTLAWAGQFAEAFQARLEIVHAVPSPSRRSERAAIEALQQSTGTKAAEIVIKEGDAVKTVIAAADSIAADLLVIGRAVHKDPASRLQPEAYAIISQSPCPVVSV